MNFTKDDLNLYLVTDRTWLDGRTLSEDVEKALKAGVTFLQLREKSLEKDEFLKSAIELKDIAARYKIPFVINDDVEIALASGADGIHIGQSDMELTSAREKLGSEKIIGVSVRTVEEAIKAEKLGADYLGVGAVFTSSTKLDASDVSYDTLKDICDSVRIPVVAIGGINHENLCKLVGSGINGVAVISSILAKKDIEKASRDLLRLSRRYFRGAVPMRKVLTIAGSDSSGGAGIQADLKTIMAHGCYGMSVITALTAQNTMGVRSIENCSLSFIEDQLDSIFTDIYPEAIKIGMVSSKEIIESIANKLIEYNSQNIVLDPVMVSTSGSRLISEDAISALLKKLMPLASLITPNLHEAKLLSGREIKSSGDMILAAKEISKNYDGYILIKGGHLEDRADDLLYRNGDYKWFKAEKLDNPNTHGTGCTLSSAIASNLSLGNSIEDSVKKSKDYISGAIKDGMDLGRGRGPLNHAYMIKTI